MCCDGADTEPMVWLGSLPPGSRICFTTTITRSAENEIKLYFVKYQQNLRNTGCRNYVVVLFSVLRESV